MSARLNGSSPARCTTPAQPGFCGTLCDGFGCVSSGPHAPLPPAACFQILEWPGPVRKGVGAMKAPSINSVATDPDLQFAVALSDQNMVIVWKRVETGGPEEPSSDVTAGTS